MPEKGQTPMTPGLTAVSFGLAIAVAVCAQAPPPAPAAARPQVAAPAAPKPPRADTRSPEDKAVEASADKAWDAFAISDPVKRLEALRKIVADDPKSARLASDIDQVILATLLDIPDRRTEISETFDRIVANPQNDPPGAQLSALHLIIGRMFDKDLVLEQAEAAVTNALAALQVEAMDLEEYAVRERQYNARHGNWPDMTAQQLQAQLTRQRAYGLGDLGRLHLAKGDQERAAREFLEAVELYPSDSAMRESLVALARIEAMRGHDEAAIAYYLKIAVPGWLKRADDAAFRALYTKARGSKADVEAEIDAAFRKAYPNPVTVETWSATPARSDRVVLAELFSNSGCGPCVAADYAFEAVLARYPSSVLAPLVHHIQQPMPDPMATPGSTARYERNGVPMLYLDGALGPQGGGFRADINASYAEYVKAIDKALETPARAALSVRAARQGDRITVSATISSVVGVAQNLRLHVALAEAEVRYQGENGVRFHPMVVRALAGARMPADAVAIDGMNEPTTGYAYGLPVTLGATGGATIDYTFDLAVVRTEITRSLSDALAIRRKREPAGVAPIEYRSEERATTVIDPAALVVVVFLQDGAKQVLQAARVSLGQASR
jgi:hypothetical protein